MKPEQQPPLIERRQRGLNDIAAIIAHIWGDRCSRRSAGCPTCAAWSIFDAIDQLTDADEVLTDDPLPKIGVTKEARPKRKRA